MPYLATDDRVRLFFRDSGSGRAIMLLGGWCASTRWWERQFSALSRDFRLVALDGRAVGLSESCQHGHRVARYARDVLALLEHLDLNDVVALGWSNGARTWLSYLELFGSERLSHLVMVDESPCSTRRAGWDFGWGDYRQVHEFCESARTNLPATVQAYVPTMFRNPPPQAELAWMIDDLLATPPEAAAAILHDSMAQDFRDLLPRVSIPVLVCTGLHTRSHVLEACRYVAEAVPVARLRVFDHSGHCPFYEEAQEFNRELAAVASSPPASH